MAGPILSIRTTGCMRTRQSPYEIVGDSSDKGGHRYQPLDRFILREVLARRRVIFYITCDDVRCFLWTVLELTWFYAICILRGFFWQRVCYLIASLRPIADRVANHLEIISKTFPTNQNSAHGMYD